MSINIGMINQAMKSKNPIDLLMNQLDPNAKEMINNMKNQSNEAKAQKIADYCNSKGISKEQLSNLLNR